MPIPTDRATLMRYHRRAETLRVERHAALDRIPDLIKRFMNKELNPHEYMSEFQEIRDIVSRCQTEELKCGVNALSYSGF
jgi:hypothetical protein